MKKLVLILVSVLLLAVFIAFNYLLWEREGREEMLRQLENNNASSSASVNSLNREVKKLEEDNGNLEADLNELKNLNFSLQSDVQRLKNEKEEVTKELYSRNQLLDALKKLVNISSFEEMMIKWVDSIDSKKFEEAYKLEYGWMPEEERKINLEGYSAQYAGYLKSIKFKSLKVDTEKNTAGSGDLALVLELEVKLAEDADLTKALFTEGDNKRLVKLKLLNEKEGFVIEGITNIQ